MQYIDLDLCNCEVTEPVFAKQGDVGRKFVARLRMGNEDFYVPEDALVSIWYDGCSGSGNYTHIVDKEAYSILENRITVELVTQMVTNRGCGTMCLILSGRDGLQLGLWNIPYMVEAIPGWDSPEAQQYYTAFSQTVEGVKDAAQRAQAAAQQLTTDTTLSIAGRAADAKTTGGRIRKLEAKHKIKLLWENGSPASTFGAQHITLAQEAADYDALFILWRHSSSYGYIVPTLLSRFILTRTGLVFFPASSIGSNSLDPTWRYMNWFDDPTDVSIHRGMRNGVKDDTAAIPVAVYGINL